ncbi:hypothetical protein G6729_01720 [Polynucleobacter paneuropaeus]|nr:hypothetical protein G6729_01720 [Polynucleobacter paneuropaeus]
MRYEELSLNELVEQKNSQKLLFTAGPASLLPGNLTQIGPCFGRDDQGYLNLESEVLDRLRGMTEHNFIARMQGSGTMALEVCASNFLYGNVLIVDTGFYSSRLKELAEIAQKIGGIINRIDVVSWQELGQCSGSYDWVWGCATETSFGIRLPIVLLADCAKKLGARLMLDATASIGLEQGHELGDVISYSSCKGLFGLTGASFIAFNREPEYEPYSFYLNLRTHLEKKVTGPYHAILSLVESLRNHEYYRESVVINKRIFMERMGAHLSVPLEFQPLLCTHVKIKLKSSDSRAILYRPRMNNGGSVICHLGEAHLGQTASGAILDALEEEA